MDCKYQNSGECFRCNNFQAAYLDWWSMAGWFNNGKTDCSYYISERNR